MAKKKRILTVETLNPEMLPENDPVEGRLHVKVEGDTVYWYRWFKENGKLVSKPDGPKEGDIYWHNTTGSGQVWWKIVMNEDGLFESKICWADGTLWEYDPDPQVAEMMKDADLKSAYQYFRGFLGQTWIPPQAAQSLHVLDELFELDSEGVLVHDHKNRRYDFMHLRTLHAVENGERFWGKQRSVSDAKRAANDPTHAIEIKRLREKMKKAKSTITEYSIKLYERTYVYSDVSEQMRFIIKQQGWSLTALGELAGVDQSILSRFMAEEVAINVETFDKLARVMMIELQMKGFAWSDYTNAVVKDRRKKKK